MKKLLLVDGHSLIHRAYHAYPKTLATRAGELTNAVYGFTNILLTAIGELSPTHVAVAFDLPKPTFREAMFVGYKQSRVKPDDELIKQIPRIKQVVKVLNIPIFEVAGYEADDVIGTLARQARLAAKRAVEKKVNRSSTMRVSDPNGLAGYQGDKSGQPSNLITFKPDNLSAVVVILTSDRDLMQLIKDDLVVIKLPRRGKRQSAINPAKQDLALPDNQPASPAGGQLTINNDIWNEERFTKDWGFAPQLLPDYKALAGDPSDDIPGVKGIGEKIAKDLVTAYGDIDNIYQQLLQGRTLPMKGQSLLKKLAEDQDSAQLSKKLATIDTNVPIKLDWQQTEIHEYDKAKVLDLFGELQFKSLIKKLPNDSFEQEVQEVLF